MTNEVQACLSMAAITALTVLLVPGFSMYLALFLSSHSLAMRVFWNHIASAFSAYRRTFRETREVYE